MPVGDIFAVQTLSSCQGVLCLNNLHYVTTYDPLNAITARDVEGYLGQYLQDTFVTVMSAAAHVARYKAFLEPFPTMHTSRGLTEPGTWAGNALPVFCTLRFKLYPDHWDRRSGWFELSGVPDYFSVDGKLDPTYQANVDYVASQMMIPWSGSTWSVDPCIWTRPNARFPTGRYTLLRAVRYVEISKIYNRNGRANANLSSQFF